MGLRAGYQQRTLRNALGLGSLQVNAVGLQLALLMGQLGVQRADVLLQQVQVALRSRRLLPCSNAGRGLVRDIAAPCSTARWGFTWHFDSRW